MQDTIAIADPMVHVLSQYVVAESFFDQSAERSKALLFSARSQKLITVNDAAYKLMRAGQTTHFPADVLKQLKDEYFIVPAGEDELAAILAENKRDCSNQDELYLVFQTSANCQLGCGYCGQKHTNERIAEDRLAKIPAFVEAQLAQANQYRSLRVCWFGAEPLTGLGELRKISVMLQGMAQDKGLGYHAKMVTNGLNLNARLAEDLVVNHKVDFFEITLDGDAESHDQRRFTKNGDPTFAKILANIIALAKLPHKFTISLRANVDARNIERISPLLRQLVEHALRDRVQFYMAPIHSWGNDAHEVAAEQEDFAAWEIDTFLEMKELGFKVSTLPGRQTVTCLAVNQSGVLIDPAGDLYNCTEVSLVPTYNTDDGQNRHRIGSLAEGITRPERVATFGQFFDAVGAHETLCGRCPILPVCGGRCPKEWKEGRIPCPPMKFNIKERMMLAYLDGRDKL